MRLLSFAAMLVPSFALAQDVAVRLDDLGSRLQFDAYAADVAAVDRDMAALGALDVPDSLAAVKATLLGFGAWRRAEWPAAGTPRSAEAVRQCVTELGRAVELEPKRAALHALLAACQSLRVEVQGRIKAPLAAGRARQSLDRALQLGPRDPHVLLVEGLAQLDRVRAGQDSVAEARKPLAAAITAFDAASRSPATDAFSVALGWGAADAWNAVGQLEQLAGNVAAARDAFERAIVLVEGYRDARERLKQLTSTPVPTR